MRCPLRHSENRGQLSCRPMPDNGKEANMWEAKRLQKGSLDIVGHPRLTPQHLWRKALLWLIPSEAPS